MGFGALPNEVADWIFSYPIYEFLSRDTQQFDSNLDYKNLCNYSLVSQQWRLAIISQLAKQIGRLHVSHFHEFFRRSVFFNRLMSLNAIYTSRRASELSIRTTDSVGVSSTHGETRLCSAVRNGSYAVVQNLIGHGVSVDGCSVEGAGPLHTSASIHNIEVAQLLLANGADINLSRRKGSPLHYAIVASTLHPEAEKKRLAFVRFLLEYGVDISVRDRDNGTVLHSAALRSLTQEIPLLLDNGAPIEAKQNSDMTALMIACQRSPKSTRLLLEGGADPNSTLPSGHDCLCLAIEAGSKEWSLKNDDLVQTIRLLIDNGADVDGNGLRLTPLCRAMATESVIQYHAVRALLDAGADIEKADILGYTPLETWMIRSNWEDVSVFDLLLQRLVNVNRTDNERRSPLIQACAAVGDRDIHTRSYIILKLMKYEADINQADANGDTPAMVICMNEALTGSQKSRLLRMLLDEGADVRLENKQGETLIVKAKRHLDMGSKERRQILNLLLKLNRSLN